MKTLAELTKETEEYFHELSNLGDKAKQSYQHILDTLDCALPKQNISALLELIPYIEEGDGYPAFQCIGKTYRILRILHLVELEKKFHQPLFINECKNAKMLLEKYMTILFALRRLSFCLSEDSVNEAIAYLQTQPVSYFSIHTLIEAESLVTDENFYELIIYAYQSHWSDEDQNNFLTLTALN